MSRFLFEATPISGLVEITPPVFPDTRGSFQEVYRSADFAAAGILGPFVQQNQSVSKKGVLRGLHFQRRRPQAKLVWVPFGEVFDVAVDIRQKSPTFGQWYATHLSGENRKLLYLPEGFAHGFYVLSDLALFSYQCTRYYDPEEEGAIRWDDKTLNIQWPIPAGTFPILSEKDAAHPDFFQALGRFLPQKERP